MATQDIVQKLWNLCNILRDDGITYHQYVTELTYILFLKMIDETGESEEFKKQIDLKYKKKLEILAAEKKKDVEDLSEDEKNSAKSAVDIYSWEYLVSPSRLTR